MDKELFESKPIPSSYLKFAMPVVLSGVLTLVYNLVDMFFVAKTGNTNIVAGVSLCAPIFTLLIAMGDVLGLGGASVMSRMLGKGQEGEARKVGTFCLYGAVILGAVISVLLLVFQNPVLRLLGTNSDTLEYARGYYLWIACGAPFVILALAPTNLLRTEGHANEAMIGSITGSIVNMILDPVFIFGLHMGAAGAAVATILGNVASDCVYIYFIMKKSKILTFSLAGFSISLAAVGAIFQIGIPSSVTNIMQSLGVMLLNNFLLPYGTDKVAVMGIVSKITIIVIMIMVGFSFGGQPLYGYLYGARMKDRLKETIFFALKLITGVSCVLSVVLALAAPLMIRVFMNDSAVVEVGVPMLRMVLIGMPFIGITMSTTCVFQSTGKALPSLVLSTARQGFVYVIMLFVLSKAFAYTGVVLAQPASDIVTACIALLLLTSLMKEINAFEE